MKLFSMYGQRVTGERRRSRKACKRAETMRLIETGIGLILVLVGIFGAAAVGGLLCAALGVG